MPIQKIVLMIVKWLNTKYKVTVMQAIIVFARIFERTRAALICAALLLFFGAACSKSSVVTVSTEVEANEIIDVLKNNGFNSEKNQIKEGTKTSWQIQLNQSFTEDEDGVTTAIQILRDYGLPRPEPPEMEENALVPSEPMQKMKQQYRTKVAIEQQLRAFPAVTAAFVNLVMPEDPSLRLQPLPAKASVYIRCATPTPQFTENAVQNIVSGAIPGLKPEDVSVVIGTYTPRRPQERKGETASSGRLIIAGVSGALVIILFFGLVLWLNSTRAKRAAELLSAANVETEHNTALATRDGLAVEANSEATGS